MPVTFDRVNDFFQDRPFFSMVKGGIGVEVGVFKGYNAINILNHCKPDKLYLVDAYKVYDDGCDLKLVTPTGSIALAVIKQNDWDGVYLETQERLKDFSNVVFVRKDSVDAAMELPDNIDWVYIDGNHSRESVLKDIKAWYPKVKRGGLIGGHDITNPPVHNAVQEWIVENYDSAPIRRIYEDWWVVK